MGQLTRGQIVTQGLAEAGADTTYTVLANVAFNAWLKKVYDAHSWPFLIRKASGVSLVAGSTSLSIGAGAAAITPQIKTIVGPINIYRSDRTVLAKAQIQQLMHGGVEWDEVAQSPTTWRGIPAFFKIRGSATTPGQWDLIPGPFPDRDFLLTFDYVVSPDLMITTTAGDSLVPLYPNDETMIQAVRAWSLMFNEKENYQIERDILAAKVMNDRAIYGMVEGTNDMLLLDGGVFR